MVWKKVQIERDELITWPDWHFID